MTLVPLGYVETVVERFMRIESVIGWYVDIRSIVRVDIGVSRGYRY